MHSDEALKIKRDKRRADIRTTGFVRSIDGDIVLVQWYTGKLTYTLRKYIMAIP